MAFKQRKTSDAPAPIPEAHRARDGDENDWRCQLGNQRVDTDRALPAPPAPLPARQAL